MADLKNRRSYTFDAALQFKDAGLVAASAPAQVAAANQILAVGAGPIVGVAVVDVSAIEVDSSNELYTLVVQGSLSATFAGNAAVELGAMRLGHATGLAGTEQTSLIGRYEIPFINVQADVVYPYIRMYTVVGGTIATGINYKAFASVIQGSNG